MPLSGWELFCLCAELFLEHFIKPQTKAAADKFLLMLPPGFETRPRPVPQSHPTSCHMKVDCGHWTDKAKPQSISGSLQSSSPLVMPVLTVSPVKITSILLLSGHILIRLGPKLKRPCKSVWRLPNFTSEVLLLLPNLFLTSLHLFRVGVKFSLT